MHGDYFNMAIDHPWRSLDGIDQGEEEQAPVLQRIPEQQVVHEIFNEIVQECELIEQGGTPSSVMASSPATVNPPIPSRGTISSRFSPTMRSPGKRKSMSVLSTAVVVSARACNASVRWRKTA